jgi:hypothetical protein
MAERFNALSRASQVHSSVNSRDTVPIRPATNQVLCPQNTGSLHLGCSSSDRLVTLYMFVTLGNNLPCHCEPSTQRHECSAWQSHCEPGACYSWTEGSRLEIASSLPLLAMTRKRSVTKVVNEDRGFSMRG